MTIFIKFHVGVRRLEKYQKATSWLSLNGGISRDFHALNFKLLHYSESCGEHGLVLPTQHLSSSTESLPSFLLEISAPQMCMVLEEPFAEHPTLLSQRTDVEVRPDQQSCLHRICKNRRVLGYLPPPVVVSIWFWYQELQATLTSVRCKPESSVFSYILWATSFSSDKFPLVQVGRIGFFTCIKACCLLNMYAVPLQ